MTTDGQARTRAYSKIGPCSGCGQDCAGEHIVGTIYAYICDACTEESEQDLDAFRSAVGAFARGEADLPGATASSDDLRPGGAG